MKKLKALLVAIGLLAGSPVLADPITMQDGFQIYPGKVGIRSDKNELRSSGGTGILTNKYADSTSNSWIYTAPDVGASANYVLTEGAQTINGAKTFSTLPTVPDGSIPAAKLQTGSAKRELMQAKVCPAGGAAASNSTVYFAFLYPSRAGIVKQITYATNVDPVSGTNTIKVLKAASNGNTMLSAASVSLNGTTINTATVATLTATGADLALTAGQPVYCEYSAGTQGAAAKDVTVTIEYEPTDF